MQLHTYYQHLLDGTSLLHTQGIKYSIEASSTDTGVETTHSYLAD